MTPRKQRQLDALRFAKHGSNFWTILKRWKDKGWLPEDEFFSVLVHGPEKTWKSKIGCRFKLLWPRCKVVEHHGSAKLHDIAGYSLVIHTHRQFRQVGHHSVNSEVASIDKCRFFATPWDTKQDAPIFYDLMSPG